MVDTPLKILIIRLSSIGDILLTSSLVRQVRTAYPESRIDFVVKDTFAELVKYNPHINKTWEVQTTPGQENFAGLKSALAEIGYDIILDLHNNLRSNYIRRGINVPNIQHIHKDKLIQSLLVYFGINRYEKILQIPERYLKVAQNIGVKDDGQGLELFLNDLIRTSARMKLAQSGIAPETPYICIAPGAAFFTKRWPKENFKALIKKIQSRDNFNIIILGGKADQTLGKYFTKDPNVFNLAGNLSLLESAFVLAGGKLLIANDTGLMHMAASVKSPVLAIFGSTVKEFGFFPYRANSIVIEKKDVKCRPCTHIGKDKCPKKHFDCMQGIRVDDVYTGVIQLLFN
ncbi:MAG: glycosyltransferase family 9 protein [Calditrichales bacterium]|nr:MAG: glycosyltransferase family 9 protein [Calditrichales bacterium]